MTLLSADCIETVRRAASCHSDESWAKLGKQLDELFGDTSASKAFRYASRCSSLEEKLALLEETVGAALYDVPEEDALRVVPRCDATLHAVKAPGSRCCGSGPSSSF